MKHTGFSAHRLKANQDNPREVAFAAGWTHENRVDGSNILAHLVPGYSDRDAQVAATVIQWLGSNVGMAFLSDVIQSNKEVRRFLARYIKKKP